MTPRSFNRISAAGADVQGIAETSVLVKVDDVPADRLWRHPAWPLCRGLAAVGFGSVHLRGAIDYFDDLADLLQGARFTQEPGLWFPEAAEHLAPEVEIVIDVTNDRASKEVCAKLCLARSSHFISLTWDRTWVALACGLPSEAAEFVASVPEGTQAEPLLPVARVAGGLALQEALIRAGRVELACPPEPLVVYNAASESRTGTQPGEGWSDVGIEDAIVDVIGCGGIGVHFLEAFAPLLGRGCELRLFDGDVVAGENLPAQITYRDGDLGRPKVLAMAESLSEICDSALVIQPFAVPYQQRPRNLATSTLRVSCADNWSVRKYANDVSLRDGVPLVDGGSSPIASQVRTFYPWRTACLEHRILGLAEKAANEQDAASCARASDATLPGTNMICGGMLAAEGLKALDVEGFGPPSLGTVIYDARFPRRLGVIDSRPSCTHQHMRGS